METILLNALAGNYRREVVNGREFIVAPLVSIVPGVLNGSKGALFYPEDEISRDPQAWNGMPLVKGHPTRNGQHISGRDPWVRANLQMGTIYNSVYDGKLQHEAWFDVEDTKRVDNWVYQQLINNRPIEVSTGLFTDNEPNRGTFNGRTYDYVARNYRPDHMAILVGQRGACSNDDGCGINVRNEEKKSLWTKLGEFLGITSNEEKKCPDCGAELDEDGNCTECDYVSNAGVYGNPQSTATGKFKHYNAGTGKGDVHEAAQSGSMLFTDEDRQRGTVDPTTWVADDAKWEKAKAAADKGGHSEEKYLTVVSHIYRRMGGAIKESIANANPEGCNQHTGPGCGGESGGDLTTDRKALKSASFEQLDKHVDGMDKKQLKEAIVHLFGSDRRAKGSVKSQREAVRDELYERKARSEKGDVIAKMVKGDDDEDIPFAQLAENSRQSDFIDCQEECDDMDCVDECLADFVGNNMPITLAQLVTNAEDDGDVQWITIGGARIPIKGGKFAAGHMKGKEYSPKGDKDDKGPKYVDLSKGRKAEDDADIDPSGLGTDKGPHKVDLSKKYGKAEDDADIDPNMDSDLDPSKLFHNTRNQVMPTRNEAINQLVTNCDCWKGKQEVLANKDHFTDDDIQRLLKNFNARKLAVNTLREIGVAAGAPATLTVNEMPAFIKAKMGKKDEEDEEQEVEVPEEEEEVMNKTTKNSAKNKPAPITERLSPDELEVWNNAVKITANEKKKIVGQLVANLEGDYRKEKYAKLMKKSMDDLREMLELRGTNNAEYEEAFVSNGIGGFFTPDFDDTNTGGRTDNAEDDGPPLALPSSRSA